MKQHITWNQFTQLSYQQVSKLQTLINQKHPLIESEEYWEKIKSHTYTFADGTVSNTHTSYISFLEKTNIGKMIDILENNDGFNLEKQKYQDGTIKWFVEFIKYESTRMVRHGYCKGSEELCDALFESLKEAL